MVEEGLREEDDEPRGVVGGGELVDVKEGGRGERKWTRGEAAMRSPVYLHPQRVLFYIPTLARSIGQTYERSEAFRRKLISLFLFLLFRFILPVPELKRNHPRCVGNLISFRAPSLLDGSSTTH